MITQIAQLLESNGYTRQAPNVSVAGIKFQFDAVFSGPAGQHGLIVISKPHDVEHFRRRLSNLCTALSRTNSHRPIIALIVANEPGVLDDIDTSCSTFMLYPSDNLAETLSPLLPLELPMPASDRPNAEQQLRRVLTIEDADNLTTSLLAAARLGEDAVETVLREHITIAATQPSGGDS